MDVLVSFFKLRRKFRSARASYSKETSRFLIFIKARFLQKLLNVVRTAAVFLTILNANSAFIYQRLTVLKILWGQLHKADERP